MSRLYLLAVLVLAACPPKTTYDADHYRVASMPRGPRVPGGSVVHPAVIEYVFATSTGPLRAYHDLAMRTTATDIAAVAADARVLAGGRPPTGEHYARARARRIAEGFNRALAAHGVQGRLNLQCCQRVDRRTGTLLGDPLSVVVVADARAKVIQLISTGVDPDYTWDLQYVPDAFDPSRPLDYATVARLAIPLHSEEPGR